MRITPQSRLPKLFQAPEAHKAGITTSELVDRNCGLFESREEGLSSNATQEFAQRICSEGCVVAVTELPDGMEDAAFDEFLQTPIMGWRKNAGPGGVADAEDDVEKGESSESGTVRVSVAPHQAVTRGHGAAAMAPSRDPVCGGGRSQELRPRVVWGYCLLQGLADLAMEDLHVAEVRTVDGEEVACFGIFDSHSTDTVARHLQSHLFDNIIGSGALRSDPATATRDAYLQTDCNILDSSTAKGGSTAVTAMILDHGRRVVVANVGDSRALLARSGKAVQLSVDHDPGKPAERASVESRGGHVTRLPGDQWRVDGQLALARSFGDKALKEHMSATPDVADVEVGTDCEFLVLGSNGLFSMFDNQEVADRVRDGAREADPVAVARELVIEARRRHCEDDISCIVIMFQES